METILVPVDGSTLASNAFEYACEQYPEAEITALHVVHPNMMYTGAGGAIRSIDQPSERVESILVDAEEIAAEYDVSPATEWRTGSPAREILDAAMEMDADCIFMGTHGRTGANRVLFGSVAERVARRAAIPVTIVPA